MQNRKPQRVAATATPLEGTPDISSEVTIHRLTEALHFCVEDQKRIRTTLRETTEQLDAKTTELSRVEGERARAQQGLSEARSRIDRLEYEREATRRGGPRGSNRADRVLELLSRRGTPEVQHYLSMATREIEQEDRFRASPNMWSTSPITSNRIMNTASYLDFDRYAAYDVQREPRVVPQPVAPEPYRNGSAPEQVAARQQQATAARAEPSNLAQALSARLNGTVENLVSTTARDVAAQAIGAGVSINAEL